MSTEKFSWKEGDIVITQSDVSKSKLHVIHYSSDSDLPQSVRDKVQDPVAQSIFRQSLNEALSHGKSEMHSFISAYKALESAGYTHDESGQWVLKQGGPAGFELAGEPEPNEADYACRPQVLNTDPDEISAYMQYLLSIAKATPTGQMTHVNRPLGDQEKEDDLGTQFVNPEQDEVQGVTIQNPYDYRSENDDDEVITHKGGPGSGPHPGDGRSQGWINPKSGAYTKSKDDEEHGDTARRMGLDSTRQALNGEFIRYTQRTSGDHGFEFKASPNTVSTVKSTLKDLHPDSDVTLDIHTGKHVGSSPDIAFRGSVQDARAKLNSIGKSEDGDLFKGGPGSGPRPGQGGSKRYSNKQLGNIAEQAGEKLYGTSSSGLLLEKDLVERGSLEDYVESMGDSGAVYDTFDFVFKPSTGEALDVADEPVSRDHADVDGNIYVAGANGIFVIHKGGPGSGPHAQLSALQEKHDQLKDHPIRSTSTPTEASVSTFIRGVEALHRQTQEFSNQNAGMLLRARSGISQRLAQSEDRLKKAPLQHEPATAAYHADTALTGLHDAIRLASKALGSKWVGKSDDHIVKRISGQSDIHLNKEGEALAAKLGVRIADKGGFDILYSSPLNRGKETAHEILEACPNTTYAKPNPALQPWHLGAFEGQTGDHASDGISHYVDNPDERPPGDGKDDGQAETFNASRIRQLTFWKDLYADWENDPTLKIGVVCHSRGLALLQAWIDNGAPDDYEVDVKDIKDPDDDAHATVYRWHKGEIKEIDVDDDDPLKPGIYPILHSLTDDDTDEGNDDLKKGGPGSGPQGGKAEKIASLKGLQQLHDRLKTHPGRVDPKATQGQVDNYVKGLHDLSSKMHDYHSAYGDLSKGHLSIIDSHLRRGGEVNHDDALSMSHQLISQAGRWVGSKWVGKAQVYLPPIEVQRAAKSAYDLGCSVIDITSHLAEGEGLTQDGIQEIAKHFGAVESATDTETTRNAWGGPLAHKWVQRVLKKIERDYPQWIGVDLDNTLAKPLESYDGNAIGDSIPGAFFDKVKQAVAEGKPIRILTARVSQDLDGKTAEAIQAWTLKHLGKKLPVTNEKDPGMTEIWDDKAHHPDEITKAGSGVMVAFTIPMSIATRLKIADGEDPSEMHVTLVYLGKEVEDDQIEALTTMLKGFAGTFAPVEATIAGPIRFAASPSSDDKDVCVASVESKTLHEFRKDLLNKVESLGIEVKKNFSYNPHVTLKYIDQDDHLPVQRITPIPVTFKAITLYVQGDMKDFPLSGTAIAKSSGFGTVIEAVTSDEYTWLHVSCADGTRAALYIDQYDGESKPNKTIQIGDRVRWDDNRITLDDGQELMLVAVEKATGSKEGTWITVNGQHILVGEDGKPLAGNPKVLGQRSVSSKVETARKSAVLTGKHEQDIADKGELKLSKALGIPRTKNNSAFDLRNGDVGIEVKTMTHGKNDKITMGKAAIGRKLAEQRAEGLKVYTVVADMRGRTQAQYYVKEGVGSFRVGSMTPISLKDLKELVTR